MKRGTLLESLLLGKLSESGTKSKSKYLAIFVSATKIDGVWVAARSRNVRLGRSFQENFHRTNSAFCFWLKKIFFGAK